MVVCAYILIHSQMHETLDQGTNNVLTEHLRALISHGAVQRDLDMSVHAGAAGWRGTQTLWNSELT